MIKNKKQFTLRFRVTIPLPYRAVINVIVRNTVIADKTGSLSSAGDRLSSGRLPHPPIKGIIHTDLHKFKH